MAMKHKIGPFTFERGGMFGGGDKVNVYKNGKKLDEFYLSEDTLEGMKILKGNSSGIQNAFSRDCQKWFGEYGVSLLGDD